MEREKLLKEETSPHDPSVIHYIEESYKKEDSRNDQECFKGASGVLNVCFKDTSMHQVCHEGASRCLDGLVDTSKKHYELFMIRSRLDWLWFEVSKAHN